MPTQHDHNRFLNRLRRTSQSWHRGMRRFATLSNLRTILIFSGFFVLVLGSIGSAKTTLMEWAGSAAGIVLLTLTAAGCLAYAVTFREDILVRPATVNDGPLPASFCAEQLSSRRDCEAVVRLAHGEFAGDAMPAHQIKRLHWKHRKDVFIAREGDRVTGFTAIFVPTQSTLEALLKSPFDPLKFGPEDFMACEKRWEQGRIYLESTVRVSDSITAWPLMMDRALGHIREAVYRQPHLSQWFVCGFGSTPEGKLLMQKRLMLPVHFTERQTGWADFYAGYVSAQQMLMIHKQAQDTVERLRKRCVRQQAAPSA